MYLDERGLELSTGSEIAAQHLSAAMESYIAFRLDAGELVKQALAADPDFAFGHVMRGYLMMLMGNTAFLPAARKSLAAAEKLLESAGERERLHAKALAAWTEYDMPDTNRHLEKLLTRWPQDLLALRLSHFNYFWQGDRKNLRDSIARVLPHWNGDTPGYANLLGMRAFGLEECGEYGPAESAGRESVSRNPKEHWATHAVAHVMEMQGRRTEGIEWMDGLKGEWPGCNNFVVHLWWHRALFHHELGQYGTALAFYDEEIRKEPSDFCSDLHNAMSMLWRLELQGVDVGGRWEELAEISTERVKDRALPFTDPHFMMALAATGRDEEADMLLESMREGPPGNGRAELYREVIAPVSEALYDYKQEAYGGAMNKLLETRGNWYRAGGSHAQRDVFEQTLIRAALKAERFEEIRELLAERTARDPAAGHGWKWYAQALRALGDGEGARRAEEKAGELLAEA